ncbi:MAG TPA: IPT/TIG domain-containing protein [Solirubrobacteraceae bacterium]|nr:IPT/TIG domain-containing protein [Solirubrobacteraceae bacterium]
MTIAVTLLGALAGVATASPQGAGVGAKPLASGAPKITLQPSNATAEEGQPASFTSTASGSPTVQWEMAPAGSEVFAPVEGATSTTYTIASTLVAETGRKFRAVFKNAEGVVTSKAVTLTVTRKPFVTKQPVDANSVEGGEATFEALAGGTPAPTTQWQESTDGGKTFKNLTGVTQSTLKLKNVPKTDDGFQFRAVFKNSTGEATSEAATLHIVEVPQITTQPLDTTVIEGESARFNSGAHGNPAPTEQWEVSTDGGKTFQAVEGATSTELIVPATTVSENGFRYRAVFTNVAGSATTSAAKLTVEGRPVVTEQPQSETVSPGATVNFKVAGTGLPTPTIQWERSSDEGATWSAVSGATSATLTIASAQLSESGQQYRATLKNPAGSATSEAALLTVSATNYRAYGWGLNNHAQAGVAASETYVLNPTPISSLHFVTEVAAGRNHSLALLAGGTVESWGSNAFGQLGDAGATQTATPIAVEHLRGVKAIAAGNNHSVALLKDGTVETWGDNESGQLGDNSKAESEVPVAVGGLSGVTAVAAGGEQTFALLSNGTVEAWGNNERGQLGIGSAKTADTPTLVKNLTGVVAISAGRTFTMALLSNGTVETWGDDEHGQLGNGALWEEESEKTEEVGRFSNTPVAVDGLSGVKAIAAGSTHALALLEDGTVVGWGDDREGQIGNGAQETAVPHPVPAGGLTAVEQIAAGEQDSAAILKSGELFTWGMNNLASLGLGTRTEAVATPSHVTTLGMVAGVSSGSSQMIAFGEQQPSVTAVSPANGPTAGGVEVTITGTNLSQATGVTFGATAASSVQVLSATTVTAIAPAHAVGTVDVSVVTPTGATPAVPADRFTYQARPEVTKLSLKGGPATGGTVVTVTGTGFAGPVSVSFGGVPATAVTVSSPTSLTATSPANVSGTLDVTVTTTGGTSATSSKDRFKYAPVVLSVTPANGPLAGANTVTLTGAGFAPGTGLTKIKFGKGASKSVVCESTSTCTVVVPAGKALGTVDVLAQANKAKSTATEGDRYTYE